MKPDDPILPMPELCPEDAGVLPDCAPLAVPYVPYQQNTAQRYDQQKALSEGTLFPGLNLPIRIKQEAAQVGNTPLDELQAMDFVLTELGLYLDTHQWDQEAMALYRQYAALAEEGRKKYEALYGPLCQTRTAQAKNWSDWLHDPWPWNPARERGGED